MEAVARRSHARVAGIALLISVISVLVLHLGPGLIAGGKRVTGTSDVAAIVAFYSHTSMLPFWWQGGISLLGILAFAVYFRRYLMTFSPPPAIAAMADFATLAAVAAVPLYALSAGLESAMVQLVAAGEPGRSALLGVFALRRLVLDLQRLHLLLRGRLHGRLGDRRVANRRAAAVDCGRRRGRSRRARVQLAGAHVTP